MPDDLTTSNKVVFNATAVFEAPIGTLRITTTTSPPGFPDHDFELRISRLDYHGDPHTHATVSLPPTGITDIELGAISYKLEFDLQGAATCTIASAADSVEIIAGEVTPETFRVDCSVPDASFTVETVTTGVALDPDGYQLFLDDVARGAIGINDTRSFSEAAGPHSLLLDGVADNCDVADNPREFTLSIGTNPVQTFVVECSATPTPPVLFESGATGDINVYAMNPDGTGMIRLTPDDEWDDEDPSWSWDGQKIVFRSERSGNGDIWVMNADGTNPVNLTNNAADNEDPAFSPDGTKIAYEEEDPDDGSLEIFVMNADGTNPMQLTDSPGISEAPSFSPDGSKILFKSDRTGNFDVYVMNADGSNQVALTNEPGDDFDGAWAPNGSSIIFSSQRFGRESLMLMNADGTNQRLFALPVEHDDWHPVFSSDGQKVIFTSDRSPVPNAQQAYELWIVNIDGSGLTRLTTNGWLDDDAEFRRF